MNFLVYDASAKIPDGIFQGNAQVPGNIYECQDVETPKVLTWNNENIEGFV